MSGRTGLEASLARVRELACGLAGVRIVFIPGSAGLALALAVVSALALPHRPTRR